ncbi:hypothetical protein FRB98_007916 [Tulasnella sp. 332]|nr:hypothetical protein FRB98_007916 [Tulasnella sp. 332]
MSPLPHWLILIAAVLSIAGDALAGPETAPLVTRNATVQVEYANPASVGTPVAVETSIPAPILPSSAPIPPQAQVPPKQSWCPSEVFCAGQLLQTVNLAQPFSDSKTFVDKPTVHNEVTTVSDFNAIFDGGLTVGAVTNYVNLNFQGEGLELEAISIPSNRTPAFLVNEATIPSPIVRGWASIVNGYWNTLVRETNQSRLCPDTSSGCESSLIPLNHTFVVPGGRFREQYYWDSFWIMEGLLVSELYDIAKSGLLNFMDEIERFGFIPNGGRIYYLNRSQPPIFIKMLSRYVNVTSDTSILPRALPLAEAELVWWQTNRTISVKSPYTGKTYPVSHYAAINTAPRPESYLEDYRTVNGVPLSAGSSATDLNGLTYTERQRADMYSEIASGAETGWDYTSRFAKDPFATLTNTTNQEPLMRGLNVRATVAVDLNSIIYDAMIQLANLYSVSIRITKSLSKRAESRDKRIMHATLANQHRANAALRKAAILDLMWDPEKMAFYDFNLTSNARNGFFSAAHFYPMWNGIWPEEVTRGGKHAEAVARKMFAPVGLVLSRYNGTFPATFLKTGAQWDAPNAYIIIQALANVPSKLSTQPYPALDSSKTSFSLVPANQLGLSESQLPLQPLVSGQNSSLDINYNAGTWTTGGTAQSGETWSRALLRGMANRYSTGGSIPGLLNQLTPQELNVTFSTPDSTGHMYEKFNVFDIDSAGSGGEYTVQAGFGWTNGAALWVAANYGAILDRPECPAIEIAPAPVVKRSLGSKVTRFNGRRTKHHDGRYTVERTREVNKWR